jgi:hypothetical protein
VSVKRPVTSEGLTSNVVPLPLPVEMLAVNDAPGTPPLRAPVVPLITHAAELPVALKLPLDWAKASPDASTARPKTVVNFFITSYSFLFVSSFKSLLVEKFNQSAAKPDPTHFP